MAQVSYGTITITDTNDINRIYVEYCRSTSNQLSGTTVPDITVNWSESTPAWVDGQYIWQRTVVEKSGTLAKTYGTPVCLTGAQGETGDQGPQGPQGGTGAAGRSLTSTTTQYTTAATSATITQSNMGSYTWSGNVPAYNANTPAYWVRVTNVYSNPSSTEYIIYKDNGITDAVKTSYDANTTATAANNTANAANQTANAANNTANNANSKADQAVTNVNNLQTKLKYYWVNEVAHTNGVNGWTKPNYPVGTYAASGISGTTFDSENSSTYGYNTWYANGINLRYNAIKLGELTGSALIFYQPSTTTQGTKAMELSSSALKFYNPSNDSIPMMQLDSSKLTFYTSAGGEIGSFGSNGLDMSGSLNIRGGGYIGVDSTNHWAFGDNRSYKDTDSAYLMGIGNASLQLGEAGHWRLDKDRIHSGWYQLSDTTRGLLHFDTGADNNQNYYWDYGLYYPNKANNGNNKFIYVRRSTTTVTNTSLTTMKGRVDDDTWWFYKFYIDGDGNVHSPSYYIINNDGTEQTLSGSGLVASSLSCGTVGSLTQPVYFNNGVPVTTTYALNAAGAKGVDTSMPTTATDNNVPTTKLMKTFVEGKGYITGYTETDPTVPSWAKASSKPTYALSEITSADDIKAIEALTGTSGFLKKTAANTWTLDTNTYLTSYTESDPTVPSWAKQSSKPSYGLTEISGTTDLQAIEALTGTTGFLKKTNSNTWTLDTSTYLTSYTETDPIFTASAAANITSSDITNWNGKTSNVGTVTSVKVQGSNGLTGSGTVTTSGTITLSHADTSSQASSSNSGRTYIQSITLDDYGHVTEISTATESVTDTHHTAYLYDTTSTGKVRVTTDTENPYLTLVENNTARSRVQLKAGTNVTSIVANNGVITFNVQDTKYTAATSAPGKVASSSSQGSSTNYARQDHTHGIDLATGDSNGQVKIAGTNVSVKGLGSWAYKSSGSASDVGLGNVLNIKQVTGIGQGNNGTIRVWKGTGTSDYEDIEVTIVATETSDVRSAQKLSSYGGASNQPIYIPSSGDNQGKPVAIDYTINKTVPADAKFTDTTYTFNDGTNGFTVTPLGGTAQTVKVTPSITNNVTGSGTNNYLAKWNGTNTITNGPKITSGGTGYLKEDGTWGTPGGTYSLPLAADGTRGGIQIGFSTNATNRNYAVALSSEKAYVNVPWTDTMVTTAALTSGTTYYPILADGANTKTRQIDSTLNGLRYVSTAGTSSVVGTAILQLGNTTASGSSNNEQGVIRLYGPGATYYVDLKATTISSSNKTITFPNKTGTVALSGDTSSSTTGLTIANHSTTNITGVSGSTTASKVTVGAHATDYGVKDRGSFTQGTDSFTAASYGTDSFTAASLSSGFYTVGTAASFTRGTFSQGSLPTLSMSVSGSQLTITFSQGTLPTHAADSFTANTPTKIDTTKFNGGSYSHSGFSGGSFTQGTDSYTGPTLGSKVVTVSADNVTVPKAATEITVVTSKTHTITDNGHTHSI